MIKILNINSFNNNKNNLYLYLIKLYLNKNIVKILTDLFINFLKF